MRIKNNMRRELTVSYEIVTYSSLNAQVHYEILGTIVD